MFRPLLLFVWGFIFFGVLLLRGLCWGFVMIVLLLGQFSRCIRDSRVMCDNVRRFRVLDLLTLIVLRDFCTDVYASAFCISISTRFVC